MTDELGGKPRGIEDPLIGEDVVSAGLVGAIELEDGVTESSEDIAGSGMVRVGALRRHSHRLTANQPNARTSQ